MPTLIQLNEAEQRLAKYLARRRYANNRKAGVTDKKIGDQSVEQTDLLGIAGEIAVAKYLNRYPDTSVMVRRGSGDLLHGDHVIDVKTSAYHTARLTAPMGIPKASVYVLVVGVMPTFRIVGWAWASDLINEGRIGDLGHGPTYVLEQEWLEKPERLKDL
jgi:hypothetical protein